MISNNVYFYRNSFYLKRNKINKIRKENSKTFLNLAINNFKKLKDNNDQNKFIYQTSFSKKLKTKKKLEIKTSSKKYKTKSENKFNYRLNNYSIIKKKTEKISSLNTSKNKFYHFRILNKENIQYNTDYIDFINNNTLKNFNDFLIKKKIKKKKIVFLKKKLLPLKEKKIKRKKHVKRFNILRKKISEIQPKKQIIKEISIPEIKIIKNRQKRKTIKHIPKIKKKKLSHLKKYKKICSTNEFIKNLSSLITLNKPNLNPSFSKIGSIEINKSGFFDNEPKKVFELTNIDLEIKKEYGLKDCPLKKNKGYFPNNLKTYNRNEKRKKITYWMKCIDFYLKEENLEESEFEGYYSMIFKEENKEKLDSFYNLNSSYQDKNEYILDLFYFKINTDLENSHEKYIRI